MFVSVSRGISDVTLTRRNKESSVPSVLLILEKRKSLNVDDVSRLRGGTAWWILG